MKKIFNKIAILLTASSLTLPLTACTFNFYVNSATKTVINSFANQTSSIVKSLVLAKEKNTDTSQTITDILEKFPNSSIRNKTSNTSLTTWEEFVKAWGFNQKINIEGFNSRDYFRATGDGELTKQINNYKNINKIFDQAKLILGINVANNRTLYNLIQSNDIKNTIMNFLNQTKKTNSDELPADIKKVITLLKNIIIGSDWKNPKENAFQESIINPLTSLLNYLVECWWTENTPTPSDNITSENNPIKNFMDNWKDKDGKPYSQWHKGKWKLSKSTYQKWNKNEYNFYRSGTLINYLFYKIGKDYQISKPDSEYKDRYLGDILTSNLKGTGLNIDIDIESLGKDLNQYLPYLLKNPSYIFLIAEAIVPLIKQLGWKINNLTKGISNLTFGSSYPTNDNINSYNILNLLNNINDLLNHPKKLEEIIKSLLGFSTTNPANAFLYDIKIAIYPFELSLPVILQFVPTKIQELVNTIMGFINTDTVKSTFKNILKIYQEWIKQYDDRNQCINIDLRKLKIFLLNDTSGLITIINKDIISILYNIFTDPKPLNEAKYLEFYQKIGGQIPTKPNEEPPMNFRSDSFLDIAKRNISNSNEPLGQIVYILFGNGSENINGIFAFITSSNNQWISNNYTRLFDINNKSNGNISKITMISSTKNNIISNTLSYRFTYKINNRTYSFLIKCKSSDTKHNYTGTKNFYFTDIILNSIN